MLMAAMGIVVLILDPKIAVQGAQDGLTLCLATLIPSLFPFFFLSSVMTRTLSGAKVSVLRPLGRLMKIPSGAESFLLIGYLGGYPVGAQCISQAYEQGIISEKDASRMMVFCNNCGPAFIFGVLGHFFDQIWMLWAVWMIQIISSILVAMVLPGDQRHAGIGKYRSIRTAPPLKRSLNSMAQVCGLVILFRVLLAFIEHWFGFLLGPALRSMVFGLLELTNGCVALGNIADTGARFVICNGLLAMGGVCITTQTFSVTNGKIPKQLYFPGKLLQCAVAVMISSIINSLFIHSDITSFPMAISGIIAVAVAIILRKHENSSRKMSRAVV